MSANSYLLCTCAARTQQCLHQMFVVETLPLALAIGCNHSGQPNLKMVNICLIPSKKTLILNCPMFYVPCIVCFLPMSFGPICFVCPMSCASPCPMHSTSTCPLCQIPAISVCEATCNKVGLLQLQGLLVLAIPVNVFSWCVCSYINPLPTLGECQLVQVVLYTTLEQLPLATPTSGTKQMPLLNSCYVQYSCSTVTICYVVVLEIKC